MRTYLIDCKQGTGFCSWSYEEPPTREKIIAHFSDLREIEGMDFPKRLLSLKFIASFWEVEITPNKGDA